MHFTDRLTPVYSLFDCCARTDRDRLAPIGKRAVRWSVVLGAKKICSADWRSGQAGGGQPSPSFGCSMAQMETRPLLGRRASDVTHFDVTWPIVASALYAKPYENRKA